MLAGSSPRSRLLFTTRDSNIAAAVGAREQVADLLSEEESRDVLARWSGTEIAKLPPLASDLIRECGRLPLALSMIGAMLRTKPVTMWTRVRDLLRHADLERINAQFPNYPYTDILRAIQVSVDTMDATSRERYVALAVLPEDMPAAVPVQQCLWNVDEGEAAETAQQFVTLSLAQRCQPEGSMRLHDLQSDYIRQQCPDQEVLPLLQSSLRLSSNVMAKDPGQFASQVIGRLLPHTGVPSIEHFMNRVAAGTRSPWLRPLQATLNPSGTALIRSLESHLGSVAGVGLSGGGRLAVSASEDQTLKVWDLGSGLELRTLQGHTDVVSDVAVSGDGRLAVSASRDRTLKVWDLGSGGELRSREGHSSFGNDVALSADGRLAVSGSYQYKLKVWEVESGRELRTLQSQSKRHSDRITGVWLSGDGRLAVSASFDHKLKLWEVESGRELRTSGNLAA